MKDLGCQFSHYEGGSGYVCKISGKQRKCLYDPPNFKKCLKNFKKETEGKEMEGGANGDKPNVHE